MKFTTGKSDSSINKNKTNMTMTILDEAFDILQSEYLWWGVTDYWHASVCIFHCELGGEARPSETENSRKSSNKKFPKHMHHFEISGAKLHFAHSPQLQLHTRTSWESAIFPVR